MYIGGASRGCSQANLTADWVAQTIAQGWTLIPTYVGLQASCSAYPNKIDPAQAPAQGAAAADDAIVQLNALGLGGGNPVYFDMEAFSYNNAVCLQATRDLPATPGPSGCTTAATPPGSTPARTPWRRPSSTGARKPTACRRCDAGTGRALVRPLAGRQPDAARRPHPERPGDPGPVLRRPPADPPVPRRPPGDLGRGHREHRQQLGRRPRRPVPAGPRGSVRAGQRTWHSSGSPAALRSRSATGQQWAASSRCRRCRRPSSTRCPTGRARGPSCRAVPPAGSGGWSRGWPRTSRPGRRTAARCRASSSTRPRSTTPEPAASGTTWPAADPRRARPARPRSAARRARQRFTWFGGYSSSVVTSHDVRWRRARWDGTFGAWTTPPRWQRTAATGAGLSMRPGYTYCVSVRARNKAKQLSGWTGGRCLARALDDRSLARSAGWAAQDWLRATPAAPTSPPSARARRSRGPRLGYAGSAWSPAPAGPAARWPSSSTASGSAR